MTRFRLLILLLSGWFTCFAQEEWTLKKNENGIAVYTRRLNSEKYKEIRVICEYNASADQLIKILQDVNNHKDWVYKTTKSYLINRKNKDTLFYYSEISVPWPASNRDAVVQLAFAKDTANKKLSISVRSIPNLLPQKPNIIRVPYSLGLYNVTTLPNNRIKIDYTLSVDPGGSLPAWLVNYTATIGPYNTFLKLKELVEK
jgi:hypothetical protein